MSVVAHTTVLPGDAINLEEYGIKRKKLIVGPGLIKQEEDGEEVIKACKAGVLKHKVESGSTIWTDNPQKRYVATKADYVIGICTARQMDTFRIDIGCSSPASISYLSFEGATKKNRPDVKVGDILYGRLLVANKHMEPELACIDSAGKANGMGVIRDGGNLIHLNLQWTRRLLSRECSLMKLLGEQLPFEVAVGMNGRIWIKGRSLEETLVLCNLIKNAQHIPETLMSKYVTKAMKKLIGRRG